MSATQAPAPWRRSRGTTAQEAAVLAAKLSRPTAAMAKQQFLHSQWMRDQQVRSATPIRSRPAKATTREEAAKLAARLATPSVAESRNFQMRSHWSAGQAEGDAPKATPAVAKTPRLTTPSEAAQVASKLRTTPAAQAKSRMLKGSWEFSSDDRASGQKNKPARVGHRRPRGMEGAKPLAVAPAPDVAMARQRTLGTHWALGGAPNSTGGGAAQPDNTGAASQSQPAPQRTSKPASSSSSALSTAGSASTRRSSKRRARGGSAGADHLVVPSADELRRRNVSSHFSLGLPGGDEARPKRSRRSAAPPPPQPPAALASSHTEQTSKANKFKARNTRSQWTLGSDTGADASRQRSRGSRKRASPPRLPPQPPQMSAHARKRQAFASTFTLG